MKPTFLPIVAICGSALGQGSLTPPASPAPVMKTLQEIWDKAALLESQNESQQQQIRILQQTNSEQSSLLGVLLDQTGVSLPWRITVVDSTGVVGSRSSLAHTPGGLPAISYYDASNADLKIAEFDGANWQTTTVDAAGTVGWTSSLAFSPGGRPAISYVSYSQVMGVKYAVFNGSTWDITTVTTGTPLEYDVGGKTSLAFSPSGQATICYESYDFSGTGGAINLAKLSGTTWVHEKVFPNLPGHVQSDWGFGPSPAFSPTGTLSISYTEYPDVPFISTLGYTTFNGSTWQEVTVDPAPGGVGIDSSLAFTPAGQPVISYYDAVNTALKCAVFNGVAWQLTTVDNAASVGQQSSLAFSPAGQPAISYLDATNGDLKYAAFDGSTWQTGTVDSAGSVGQSTSLDFTPGGQPGISYFDATRGDLKFAVRAPFTSP